MLTLARFQTGYAEAPDVTLTLQRHTPRSERVFSEIMEHLKIRSTACSRIGSSATNTYGRAAIHSSSRSVSCRSAASFHASRPRPSGNQFRSLRAGKLMLNSHFFDLALRNSRLVQLIPLLVAVTLFNGLIRMIVLVTLPCRSKELGILPYRDLSWVNTKLW